MKEEGNMTNKQAFAKFIAEKRNQAGLTQKQLASRLFVSDTTVSKWERGLSYPDITLISQICEELGITEHEFITASDDRDARIVKAQARRYRKMVMFYQYGMSGAYLLALLICLICNIAIGHTLDWFFIVFASLLLAFSVTVLPTLAFKPPFDQHRALISMAAATLCSYLLLAVCCAYTRGDWFFSVALPVSGFGWSIPWIVLVLVRYTGIHTVLKTGLIVLYSGLFSAFINPVIDLCLGNDLSKYLWHLNFMDFSGENYMNKILFYVLIGAGLVLVLVGAALQIRRFYLTKRCCR